jgi:hypothetical protein
MRLDDTMPAFEDVCPARQLPLLTPRQAVDAIAAHPQGDQHRA